MEKRTLKLNHDYATALFCASTSFAKSENVSEVVKTQSLINLLLICGRLTVYFHVNYAFPVIVEKGLHDDARGVCNPLLERTSPTSIQGAGGGACVMAGLYKRETSLRTHINFHTKAMYLYLLGLLVLYKLYRWCRELPRVPDKDSKYVYITGCDTGFGNLLARHLDKKGFKVIASCFSERGEEDLKKSCSGNLTTTHLDVRSKDSVAKVAAMIKEKVGERGLWAVVNNAGVSVPSAPCDWLTIDDYKSMLDVNLNGVIAVTLSVLQLIKKARGRVVNVASVFGRISATGGPYTISKYGVEAFNDSLRLNMAPFGVKVLCIEPGFFKTNVTDATILSKNVMAVWDRLPQDVKDDYGTEYLEKSLGVIKDKVAKISDGDLMKVVGCMEHAVSAVQPRTRYSPGWDAKLFWLPLSYMPTCVSDYILTSQAVPIAKN